MHISKNLNQQDLLPPVVAIGAFLSYAAYQSNYDFSILQSLPDTNQLPSSFITTLKVLAIPFAICLFTYCITTVRFILASFPQAGKICEPPTLPYFIPFVGSTLLFANTGKYFKTLAEFSKAHGILGVRLGNMYTYWITGLQNTQTVYRNSRYLSGQYLAVKTFENTMYLNKQDTAIFVKDSNSNLVKSEHAGGPMSGIWKDIWNAQQFKRSSLQTLDENFIKQYLVTLANPLSQTKNADGTWKALPLFQTFRKNLSIASTATMLGTRAFEHNPDVVKDFWHLFDGLIPLTLGLPRVLCKKSWDARASLIDTFTKVIQDADNLGDQDSDLEWNEHMGARLNRDRDATMKAHGISQDGRAKQLMGVLLALNGNATNYAGWMMLELVQRPKLLEDVRREAENALDSSNNYDMEKLTASPVLSAVWQESLRLRAVNVPFRELLADIDIGGYRLKKGNTVAVPVSLAHRNEAFWDHDGMSPTEFYPERFLAPNPRPIPGSFGPFGGGGFICPGRAFAKNMVMVAVAVMVQKFDFEFVSFIDHAGAVSDRAPMEDFSNCGIGTLAPDGDCLVRFRERLTATVN